MALIVLQHYIKSALYDN